MNLSDLCIYAPESARHMFDQARTFILAGKYSDAATVLDAVAEDAKLPYQRDAKKLAKEFRTKAAQTGVYKT